MMESLTKVFLLMLSKTNRPTSVFFAICSASCYRAITGTKPYLLASFLATVTLLVSVPPTTRTEAGLLGRLALILNFKSRAMSSRISYREPVLQSISK